LQGPGERDEDSQTPRTGQSSPLAINTINHSRFVQRQHSSRG
jgi:hypothetical protein